MKWPQKNADAYANFQEIATSHKVILQSISVEMDLALCKNNFEQETLQKFQTLVADLELDIETCRRFLVAREYQLQAAEKMIRNHVKWRKEINLEYLMNEWKCAEDVQSMFDYSCIGKATSGAPVYLVNVGLYDPRPFVENGRGDELINIFVRSMERTVNDIRRFGAQGFVGIHDYEGLNYSRLTHYQTGKLVYSISLILEENFPELIETITVVNSPALIYYFWSLVKPIMSKKTISKFNFFGSDKTKYVPFLRSLMPEEVIPKKYLN